MISLMSIWNHFPRIGNSIRIGEPLSGSRTGSLRHQPLASATRNHLAVVLGVLLIVISTLVRKLMHDES